MIKLIIFDYDGVIVDSFPQVYEIYRKMCLELGKPFNYSLAEFKVIYGHSASECYAQLRFTDAEKEQGNLIFKRELGKQQALFFPEIGNVLSELSKKYTLVLVSAGYEHEITEKLTKAKLISFFAGVHGRTVLQSTFKKTEKIKQVLHDFNMAANEVILIGDRNVDYIEGTQAGLRNIILVDYGWGYDLNLIPSYIQKYKITTPNDLLKEF
jgi:phosphoglycolate phosphatase